MTNFAATAGRRTTADDIFDQLRADIVSLRLEPGTKLSEAEVALQRAVSRQPVREAFIRLSNANLLLVRPQKATLVRKISISALRNARFIRTAVEVEVVARACMAGAPKALAPIRNNIARQTEAVKADDRALFETLDYEFHRLLCIAADCAFAFEAVAASKAQVDRLCMLSLADAEMLKATLGDHVAILEAIRERDTDRALRLTREHLSRIDGTIKDAQHKFPDYFEE